MRALLLVDDDASVVSALKKALRPFREEWTVETAEGGRAALTLLSSQRFDAVVSDARMPDVDGEAVLEFARVQQPSTVRLVLSGQVDAKTGHRLASVAHQFLTKPSAGATILAAVEECCRLCDTLADPRVRELVTSLGPLPSGPRVYHRITALIDAPASSVEEVSRVIEGDLGLSASLLRFVSSAFFGLTR
jgi:DNA-binding NtrC family response regulator